MHAALVSRASPRGPRFAQPEGKLPKTPISGLPEIGAQMRASRVNPTCVDPAQEAKQSATSTHVNHVLGPLGPGSRARTDTVRKIGRRGARLAGTREGPREDAALRAHGGDRARCRVIPIHNFKQRSLLRSRGALLRPGFAFLFPIHPDEGRAERRKAQYFCCRAVGRDDPRLLRRGARPAGRARLSALHRGDFGSGAALPSPAFLPDQCSELLAARS
jgi:hypothetical protein